MGACELVAEPVKPNSTGSCAATMGSGNGSRLSVGAIAGISRTMKVVVTLSVVISGSLGLRKYLNVARAVTVSETNDPHGAAGLTVPVHCQLLPAGKVAAASEPPGPNCADTLLLLNDHVLGTDHEMLPPS